MSFVDDLRKTPAPVKQKTQEELYFDRTIESAHDSIKKYCVERRQDHHAAGYLAFVIGGDGGSTYVKCFSRLYRYDYPYKIDLGKPRQFEKSKHIYLQLGDDTYDGIGNGPRRPISQDSSFCTRLVQKLYSLLQKDGFSSIDLKVIQVYAAEIKRYARSGLLSASYYEEGKLTNKCEGYVISVNITW